MWAQKSFQLAQKILMSRIDNNFSVIWIIPQKSSLANQQVKNRIY